MRIVEIVPSVADEASGPSYSVVRLCQALAGACNEVHLVTLGSQQVSALPCLRHSVYPQDFAGVLGLKKLRFSRAFVRALNCHVAQADIVHNHSLWLMPNVDSAHAAVQHRKPLIVSPRGTLASAALKVSPHVKRVFWALLQGSAVRSAACLHATSEQEYLDIRRAGLRQPVAIIPNGIDLPVTFLAAGSRGQMRTLLYLGRLHPIKGIDALLTAWRRVASAAPDWQLRIVGPDERGYRARLERLACDLDLPRTEFAGPRYGAEKAAEYAAAELYVLPSHTENFGMSVAEALAHATPVITTTGTPWAGVREHGCGWRVEPNSQALEAVLREALALDPAFLAAMGRAGRDWMECDFAWSHIGERMAETYRWLVSGGSTPDFVRTA